MCGIIGYSGYREALPVLIDGLKRLEYRGYDSAGFSLFESKKSKTMRTVGKVIELEKKSIHLDFHSTHGIAHTRWATHGKPSEANAHPHHDCTGKISLVHNGIIENYQDLKEELVKNDHTFNTETDTEVVAHMIEDNYQGDLEVAVLKTIKRLEGTFGIAVVHADEDHRIVVFKRGSPIIIGLGDGEHFVSSDANAISAYTHRLIYLNDDEIAVFDDKTYYLKNLENELLTKRIETCETRDDLTDKKGFEHFMLKEIHEQPESIENAFRGRIVESEGVSKLGGLEPVLERLKHINRLIIVSCGTSYYAGQIGGYIFEQLTDLDTRVEMASEFRYRKLNLDRDTAVLAISQSGETADTLAGIREAKRKDALILGIVNMVGSSITQVTDAGVYNHAGPEFGVASTKIYTSQLVILTLMALLIGRSQRVSFSEGVEIIGALKRLPDKVRQILKTSGEIERIARQYAQYKNFLYIGRQYNFPSAMEGALKLKEISYVHAEGYPAGEMKHGPISLIDEHFPTVAVAPVDSTFDKMISNIQQIKARDGRVLALTNEENDRLKEVADDVIVVPSTIPLLQPILNIIPLQLFAYFIAKEKGCDIDKPRNLAKSVTVE